MANTTVKVNVSSTWTSGGTSDTLTCDDINPNIKTGVQIGASGITLENATITVTKLGGITQTVTAETGSGNGCLVGYGWQMTKIVISNVASGTYTPVIFSQ
jgi:hypothetical protein